MNLDFRFIAKSAPAICILAGVLFLLLDQTAKTNFGFTSWILILVGVFLSLIWAKFFKNF